MKRILVLVLSLALAAAALPAQTAHSVVLSWTASSDAAANPGLTYNIFRGPGTCLASTVFTQINTSPVTTITFTDTNVTIGAWYCYGVQSVLNGATSTYSLTNGSEGGTSTPIPVAGPTTIVIVSK